MQAIQTCRMQILVQQVKDADVLVILIQYSTLILRDRLADIH
jgi:hypothetical protein